MLSQEGRLSSELAQVPPRQGGLGVGRIPRFGRQGLEGDQGWKWHGAGGREGRSGGPGALEWDGDEPGTFLRPSPLPVLSGRKLQAQKPTFHLLHFVLEGHRAPPLGWERGVGGRLVFRRVVFQQHHVRP